MYRDAGDSFVSITDHNRVTRCDDLNDGQFLAIPGTEDTVSQILPPLGPHMARLFVTEPLRTGTSQDRIDRTLASGTLSCTACAPIASRYDAKARTEMYITPRYGDYPP
jgi:hypothetical protein